MEFVVASFAVVAVAVIATIAVLGIYGDRDERRQRDKKRAACIERQMKQHQLGSWMGETGASRTFTIEELQATIKAQHKQIEKLEAQIAEGRVKGNVQIGRGNLIGVRNSATEEQQERLRRYNEDRIRGMEQASQEMLRQAMRGMEQAKRRQR